MPATAHRETAPADRIPFLHKLAYGSGAFANNLLATASGSMMIILNLGFGMNPALVGLLGAIPRITDAFTDPVVGYLSDNASTRWGRRRPFIVWGAIASAVVFFFLWQIPGGQSQEFIFGYFLVGSLLFYLAYTFYSTAWVALGFELTPDYHERTRLMGVSNFTGQFVNLLAPWFLWFVSYEVLFDSQADGAAVLAGLVAVVVIATGIVPGLVLREPMRGIAEGAGERQGMLQNLKAFLGGFSETLQSRPFLYLAAATFLIFNGFILIGAFQSYVIIYYVFGGNELLGAEFVGWAGTVGAVSAFAIVAFATWLGTRVGKRRALMITTSVSVLGYGLKWFSYNPELPWLVLLPAPLMAFGFGGLFTLVPAMLADVVDLDELKTHERREGMFGSIYWWIVKLGLAAAAGRERRAPQRDRLRRRAGRRPDRPRAVPDAGVRRADPGSDVSAGGLDRGPLPPSPRRPPSTCGRSSSSAAAPRPPRGRAKPPRPRTRRRAPRGSPRRPTPRTAPARSRAATGGRRRPGRRCAA